MSGLMDVIVAEPVFWLFGVPVRNSVISTWVLMALAIVGVVLIRRRTPILLEMLIDFTENLASGFIPGKVEPYVPFLGSLLLFIAVANLSGILPLIFTPTRDINTPLALALVVLVAVFAFTIHGVGGFHQGLPHSPAAPQSDRVSEPHHVTDLASVWQRRRQ
jgi:F-type H+-transporting ATPase subunit a